MRHFLSALLICLAGWATAQSYPEPSELSVNDFAGIIGEEAEARLTSRLDTLREQSGVELVVLTLSRQEMFAPDISLKKFASGIFDEWGIGDKKRDDGILVLVLRGDQAIRIALGKGYGNKADKASDKAVERSFLPEFREDRYEQGIERGVDDLIENVVGPHLAKLDISIGEDSAAATSASAGSGEAAASATGSTDNKGKGGSGLSWLLYIVGGIGALIAFFKIKGRMRKCPECGARGLTVETRIVEQATETSKGEGERITSCAKCGYRDVESYEIAKRSKPEPEEKAESFGGGEAGKKGSTGKW